MAWKNTTSNTTKHNDGCTMAFGRPSNHCNCPRCEELVISAMNKYAKEKMTEFAKWIVKKEFIPSKNVLEFRKRGFSDHSLRIDELVNKFINENK